MSVIVRPVAGRAVGSHVGIPQSLRRGLVWAPDLLTRIDPITQHRGVLDGTSYNTDGDYRSLNGTTDRIDWGLAAGSMPNFAAAPFSFAAWIFVTSIANSPWIWQTQRDATSSSLFLAVTSTGRLQVRRETEDTDMVRASANATIGTGAWHHVAVTGTGTLTAAEHTIYNAGAAVGSYAVTTDGTGTERATTYSWSLGGSLQSDSFCLAGRIRQPLVWDRVLSASEAAALAALPRPA